MEGLEPSWRLAVLHFPHILIHPAPVIVQLIQRSGCWLDDQGAGFCYPAESRAFCLSKTSRLNLKPTQHSSQWVHFSFPTSNASSSETGHWPVISIEVYNIHVVLYLPSPLYLHVIIVMYEIWKLFHTELQRLLEIWVSNSCDYKVKAISCFHCQSTFPEDTVLYKDYLMLNELLWSFVNKMVET